MATIAKALRIGAKKRLSTWRESKPALQTFSAHWGNDAPDTRLV
jgi:hypothetical protein